MNLKETKGITLIALVITIIILLILASVSIAMLTGENGLLTRASDAKNKTEMAEVVERVKLDLLYEMSDDSTLTKDELKKVLTKYFDNVPTTIPDDLTTLTLTAKESYGKHSIKISDIYNGKLTNGEPITYAAYTRGQEITIGQETFYVLEDSDETKETVTLFAKYNLNTVGTAQQANANYGDTACAFSTSNYWENENLNVTVTPKLNLNEYEAVITDTASAVYKAKSYATTLLGETVKGRLLTYEEAVALETAITTDTTGKIAEMLWGQANTQESGNFLMYWLGSAFDNISLWGVKYIGSSSRLETDCSYNYPLGYGVRPVIEVSKSLI